MLPVSTPELTPGAVISRPMNLPGIGALFLVGDDALSRAWLSDNAARLQQLHAAGMIVNVQNVDGVASLRALAPGLSMAPASGSTLARRLQLSHYPVLIPIRRWYHENLAFYREFLACNVRVSPWYNCRGACWFIGRDDTSPENRGYFSCYVCFTALR